MHFRQLELYRFAVLQSFLVNDVLSVGVRLRAQGNGDFPRYVLRASHSLLTAYPCCRGQAPKVLRMSD
jgi:hypothetical protein